MSEGRWFKPLSKAPFYWYCNVSHFGILVLRFKTTATVGLLSEALKPELKSGSVTTVSRFWSKRLLNAKSVKCTMCVCVVFKCSLPQNGLLCSAGRLSVPSLNLEFRNQTVKTEANRFWMEADFLVSRAVRWRNFSPHRSDRKLLM